MLPVRSVVNVFINGGDDSGLPHAVLEAESVDALGFRVEDVLARHAQARD